MNDEFLNDQFCDCTVKHDSKKIYPVTDYTKKIPLIKSGYFLLQIVDLFFSHSHINSPVLCFTFRRIIVCANRVLLAVTLSA